MTIDAFRDDFYRCRFSRVAAAGLASDDPEARLLAAAALFELHRVAEARAVLEVVGAQSHDEALYAQARLAYLDERHADAARLFRSLSESRAPLTRFRGALGLANCLYSEGDLAAAADLAETLGSTVGADLSLADRASARLFEGNLASAQSRLERAERAFLDVLREATAAGWPFFQLRALYGLVGVAERAGAPGEARRLLTVLVAMVDATEARYFSHLVNRRFAALDAPLPSPVELDEARSRVRIGEEWRDLHDKPLVYAFLRALAAREGFHAKEAIAAALWPDERYHPEIHDPRIFNLARRTRALIEAYEEQPVALLSSRLGYRLVRRAP